jgi:hypothetical protein
MADASRLVDDVVCRAPLALEVARHPQAGGEHPGGHAPPQPVRDDPGHQPQAVSPGDLERVGLPAVYPEQLLRHERTRELGLQDAGLPAGAGVPHYQLAGEDCHLLVIEQVSERSGLLDDHGFALVVVVLEELRDQVRPLGAELDLRAQEVFPYSFKTVHLQLPVGRTFLTCRRAGSTFAALIRYHRSGCHRPDISHPPLSSVVDLSTIDLSPPSTYFARSSFFNILPVGVRGNSSTKMTFLGVL